ncbi:MAG: transglutaminase domain-containing protein [Opitutales bacterium]
MKFEIEHRTSYRYEGFVADSVNDVHLCPVSDDSQICHSFELDVRPTTPNILRRLDFFTNQVHHIEVHTPHEALTILARSFVETFPDERNLEVPVDPAGLKLASASERFYDYTTASQRVSLGPAVTHEAKEIVPQLRDVREAVEGFMVHIYEHFHYVPGHTSVETSVAKVIEERKGVCQDFAHVMLAYCRVSGIPARYVSGYFHVEGPKPGTEDDNHASHAWVECYLPGVGWVGYDPTHNRIAGAKYIKVAVGRDYTDVRPVAGTFRGQARAQMEVGVRVKRVD